MAQEEFNPLDPYSELPALVAPETDLGAYLPEPYEPKSRGHRGPVSYAVNKDLPPEARALLDVIASDEAPDYNTMYGGRKFENMSQHPGIYTDIKSGPNAGRKSSAAGRYQFLKSTWDSQAGKLGLSDFSPENQDLAAWDLASSTYANKTGRDLLGDLRSGDPRYAGRISSTLSSIWTSLPGGIEQRSRGDAFVNRYTQSLAQHGGEVAPQGPQGETYDIPLSNGQILHAPVGVPREEAIANIRASGLDVEGLTPHKLTTGQTLHIPDSVNIADALVNLQKQSPDQEWMTEEHAKKIGLGPAFGATLKGLVPTAERGVGEIAQEFGISKELGNRLIKDAEARQAEIGKGFEETLSTDPLSKRIGQNVGTVLGGAAGTLPLAGLAMTGGLGAGAAALAGIPMAAGSLGQRYAEQGKDMSLAEPGNLATVAAEAAGNVIPLAAGKAGASLLQNIGRGAAAAGAVDVPSVALERAAAGQPLADEKAIEEYLLTGAGSVLGGGAAGAIGGMRGRGVQTPEVPPVQEGAAPSPVEPAPTGGEALAPTEGPIESVEDLEAQAKAGEEFFRQAEAAKAAEPAPEMVAPEMVAPEMVAPEMVAPEMVAPEGLAPEMVAPEMVAPEMVAPEGLALEDGIPEPTVRGREQAMPTVEEAPIGEAEVSPKRYKGFETYTHPETSEAMVRVPHPDFETTGAFTDMSKKDFDAELKNIRRTIDAEERAAAAPAEAHFAESVLGLKPTKAKTSLYNKLQGLDIGSIEDHPKIEELVNKSNILSRDQYDALSARMKEVEDAQQIPQAGAPDGRGGAQPGFREEGRDQAIGGEGVEPSGQGIKAPEVKFAKAEEVEPVSPREFMHFKDVTKRIPELQEAANQLKTGEISPADYDTLVDKHKPVTPYRTVPKPASVEDMNTALSSDKVEKIGKASESLNAGDNVGLRLDIPAYANHGTWVVTVHTPRAGGVAGKPIGYESAASIRDVNFGINEKAGLNIAAGKGKATIATMEGKWNPVSPEEAIKRGQQYLNDPDWVQVGMDPERHAYFYDRKTMEPVTHADEVLQIGGLVFAKNPTYAPKREFLYSKAEEPTHIDVDGVQRPMHDSTGQRIHTTDEGVKNFWKGFEGTKVTDEMGRPIRLYHGTDKDFSVFKGGRTDFGIHLGTEGQANERLASKDTESARTIQAYLNIKNLLRLNDPGVWDKHEIKWQLADNFPEDLETIKALQNFSQIKKYIKSKGYDGVVYKNRIEVPGRAEKEAAGDFAGSIELRTNPMYWEDSYIALDSKQIKSATGNVGKFDTTKPDIFKAEGVAPEAAHSVETLNDHIAKTYGKEAPQVDVLTREQAGVEPNVKGFYDPNTKRVTLIADNIGKGEDVHGLMRHEVAVHAKRLGKTDPEFQSILDRLQKLKDSGDANVARAYDRVPKDTNPEHIHEEALAYLTQEAPNLPISKSFMSWMRRMAHKLTGSANWLKADDFAPMADAILKRGEPTAAPKERMYSIGDTADEAVRNANTETWFERFYTPIRTQYASVRAPLEAILGKLPLYDENNEIRATAKIAQQTRYAHIVSEALHTGYLKRNAQGLVEAVFDPQLSPDRLIKRVMEMPEDIRDRFSESMVTLAQAGHNLRGAEMKAVMDEAQRKIKLGQAYLDKTKSNYDRTKATLDTVKSLSGRMKDNPRVQRELERAQREFDAAKAEYRNPNYTAGKDYIALQQRLYKAVNDQFSKARRDAAGKIYDISPAQERAAREFIESNPEAKQLAADIRELFTNNAKLLRDTSVISNETYKKFTDSKYNYAPLYMSIEDLDASMPASAVYLQGGQRKVMPVKGLKGGQHQISFFENLMAHQARTGAMALHNNARLGSLDSLVEMGRAKELPGTAPPPKTLDVVAAIKDGKRRYYHVPDRPLYEAFEMVHNLPVPDWITDTTKFASRAMLVNPKYWWNQLVREPFMATFTTRAGVITPFHTGKEFASLLFSELPNVDTSAAQLYRELKAQGVSGSHEYLRDLIKEKGKLQASKGLAKNYKDSKDLVMRIHEYADAATKVAVMRKALERAESGKLTGTPLRGDAARDAAITHVGDMINFANRGRNATVQYITQATPFFNSWAQGMDAIIRSATGYGMDPHAKGKTIAGLRTTFLGHAAAMMAFSAAITALRCELSEDYRNAEPDEWSGNWLIPIPDSFETKEGRMVKAKGPFELNTLFKLGPEMWVRNWYGLDRDKDYTSTIKSSIWRDIAPPGLDHLFMPYLPMLLLESVTGYRASEGEIKPLADTSLAPAERGKGVSPIADVISAGVLSPASVKHLGQGFFGGMYDMLDSTAKGAAAAFGSDTARADLRDITEKVPVISGMLTNPDHIELGQAYEFADKQAMARHTAKVLGKRGDKEGAAEYKEEGRYAKQAERIKRKISKTNTAIERLKNTKEYEDADKLQREYEAQLEKKRKQVGKLEALQSKAEGKK